MLQDEDEYIVIASDGLWTTVDEEKALKRLEETKKGGPKAIADGLLKLALDTNGKDNTSILVLQLN